MPKKYVTPKQAQSILGVSEKTLRNWDEQGKIRTIRTPSGIVDTILNPSQEKKVDTILNPSQEKKIEQVSSTQESVVTNKKQTLKDKPTTCKASTQKAKLSKKLGLDLITTEKT